MSQHPVLLEPDTTPQHADKTKEDTQGYPKKHLESPLKCLEEMLLPGFAVIRFPSIHSSIKQNLDVGASRYNCLVLNPWKAKAERFFKNLAPLISTVTWAQWRMLLLIAKLQKRPLESPKISPLWRFFASERKGRNSHWVEAAWTLVTPGEAADKF